MLTADEFTTRFKKKKQALAETPRTATEEDSRTGCPSSPSKAARFGRRAGTSREGRRQRAVGGRLPLRSDVDLSDGDWADYDVEADAPVALSDIETKVELVR